MRVVVGRIGRPHGIKGEVTVDPRTDEPDRRFAPGSLLAVDAPAAQLLVLRTHWHSGRLLVAFQGINDRAAAEALRGLLLHVDRDPGETPDDSDEFYDSSLVDCTVVRTSGEVVGVVTDVLHLPGQDMLVVDAGGREVLVPFLAAFVPQIDLPGRQITIAPPDGLIDEA